MAIRGLGSKSKRSEGVRPGLKHFYRPTWTVPAWDEFVLGHALGTIVQVCPGGSMLGIARIDVTDKAPGMNVKGSALSLPIRSESIDTVACDPPYEMGFPLRVVMQRELFRVARQRVIFKAPWIPRGSGWDLKVTVLLCSHTCQNVAILSMLERRPEHPRLI